MLIERSRDTNDAQQQSYGNYFFLTFILKYWFIWCCRNAQRKSVLCEDLTKKRTKNLSSFPLSQTCFVHLTITTDPYWGWTKPITDSQHDAEQELRFSCFHSLGSVLSGSHFP